MHTRTRHNGFGTKLEEMGFTLEFTSESGSQYFVREGFKVRVSDHYVPITPEREYNRATFGCKRTPNFDAVATHFCDRISAHLIAQIESDFADHLEEMCSE